MRSDTSEDGACANVWPYVTATDVDLEREEGWWQDLVVAAGYRRKPFADVS